MRSLSERLFPFLYPPRPTGKAGWVEPSRKASAGPPPEGRTWEAKIPAGKARLSDGSDVDVYFRKTVTARTKSEARAILKARLEYRDRLPVGTVLR